LMPKHIEQEVCKQTLTRVDPSILQDLATEEQLFFPYLDLFWQQGGDHHQNTIQNLVKHLENTSSNMWMVEEFESLQELLERRFKIDAHRLDVLFEIHRSHREQDSLNVLKQATFHESSGSTSKVTPKRL